jgi:hypothetical protein
VIDARDQFNFKFEEIADQRLQEISGMASLAETRENLEVLLKTDGSNWQARKKLAFLYAGERISSARRWDFNFGKGIKLLREGLEQAFDDTKCSEIDGLIEQYRLEIIFNPLPDAVSAMKPAFDVRAIPLDDRVASYIELKKKELTCKQIWLESHICIPRGQIITDQRGDYWYDGPIEASYRFSLGKDCRIKNSAVLRLLSLMNCIARGNPIQWTERHYICDHIPQGPEYIYHHNLLAVCEMGSTYSLTVTSIFLEETRQKQLGLLSEAMKMVLRGAKGEANTEPSQADHQEVLPIAARMPDDVEVLLVDMHGISSGLHLVKDVLLNAGFQADILSPADVLATLASAKDVLRIVGISASDRHIEECLSLVSRIQASGLNIPIMIGGASTLQYREFFSIIPGENIFLCLGDGEEKLPSLISLLYRKYRQARDISTSLSQFNGLLYRTGECIGIIRPDVTSQVTTVQLFLPKPEQAKKAYDWNPSRGCPKRCAYCNNVQGRWRSASLLAMKNHMLAIVGHVGGFTRDQCDILGGILEETISSLNEPTDLRKNSYSDGSLQKIIKVFHEEWHVRVHDCEGYLAEFRHSAGPLSRVFLFKALLVLNGLHILENKRHDYLDPLRDKRITIYTASDNFLVETRKIADFFDWLIQMGLKSYFSFRTQTSLDFLWDSRNNRPNENLMVKMLDAGIESLGFGYDSSSNAIGDAVLKRNSYNRMIKTLDSMVRVGFRKENIRIHHFYSSPISSFADSLEGLLLSESNIANDRGNMIALILYTYRSEMGMLCKMNFAGDSRWLENFKHVRADDPAYSLLHSEASPMPMLDSKAEKLMQMIFVFDPEIQEYVVADSNRSWLFASCFADDIRKIIQRWCSDEEEDSEIRSLGRLFHLIHSRFPAKRLIEIFRAIKYLCIHLNTFSFERLLIEHTREDLIQTSSNLLK